MPPKLGPSSRLRANQASSASTPGSINFERLTMDSIEAKAGVQGGNKMAEDLPDVPPYWRAPLSNKADLGYPDFVPARPGFSQPEDRITEQNVKQGFQGINAVSVQTEGFSVHAPINQRLKSTAGNAMESLSRLADEIMAVKAKSVPVIPKWTYKLPNRVVYNETMRQSFIADLVNPNFPLQRLARSIPHGYRGNDLLEMLYARSVPFDRAAWLVQALGAHEVVAIRNRASTSTTLITPSDQYSIEFTTVYCAFLRKQLAEITLPQRPVTAPSAKVNEGKQRTGQAPAGPRPGIPNKNLLADPQSRDRWLAKWDYSLELVKWLMSKRLIHERTWTGWLADQVAASHPGQLGFVLSMMDHYMDMVFKSKMIARAAVRAMVEQLGQIRTHRHRSTLSRIEGMLRVLIQSAFVRSPDLLVCPPSWLWHEDLLHEVLGQADCSRPAAFENIKKRNDAMLLRDVTLASGGSNNNRRAMAAIQVLDSMDASSKLRDIYEAYFVQGREATAKGVNGIDSKIQMLLSWSTGFGHLGPHRPYLCSSLLTIVKQDTRWTALRKRPDDWLELVIFDWLDETATSMPEVKFNSVGITIGDLTRVGLFSLGDYLRRQVARGVIDTKRLESKETSRLISLLKHLPAFATAPALLNLRNRVLGGMGVSPRNQAAEVQLMKDEMTSYLASWKDLVPDGAVGLPEVSHDLPCTKAASRYVQVQLRMWTLPVALRTIGRLTLQGEEGVETFARIMHTYEAGRGIASIHQILLRAIPTAGFATLDSIIYTVMRHLDVWAAMDCLDSLSAAIFDRYFGLADDGVKPKHQSPMCWELAHKAHLMNKHANIIRDWLTQEPHPPVATDPAPEALSTVQSIHQEGDLVKVESTARLLSERFDQDPRFPTIVWRCATDSLAAAQQMAEDHGSSLSAITRLLTVIGDLHDLRPSGGLRGAFAQWADQHAQNSFVDLHAGAPDTLADFLLQLVDNRILMGKAILHHLILPIWLHLSQSRTVLAGTPSGREVNLLQMSSTFCRVLFLSRGDRMTSNSPWGLRAAQCFWAHTAAIFEDSPAMEEFIQHLAVLPLLELSFCAHASATSRDVTMLREGVSALATFKKAAYRHLDVLKEAFLTRRAGIQHEKKFDTRLVEALLLIMTDNEDAGDHVEADVAYDWTDERAELSPWQWKRTVLELRLSLKRLSMHLEEPDAPTSATSSDEFAATLLDRPLTNDQVALVEEAMKGIDPGAADVVLKAGIVRLSTHLQHMVDAGDDLRLDMLDQVRTVARVLAITLQQSRASGYQHRASAAGISDPSHYVQSLASLVKRLNDPDSSNRSDVLQVATLTLRLYLCMVGGTAGIGTLSTPVVVSLMQSAFELSEVNQDERAWTFYKDLFSFVLDELPREKRFIIYDKLLDFAQASRVALPPEVVPEEILELVEIFKAGSQPLSGGLSLSPWEALPYFGQDNARDQAGGGGLAAKPLDNGGSVDLLAFRATLTGERLQGPRHLSDEPDELDFEARPWEVWASERASQGLCGSDSAFARGWATGLLENPPVAHRFTTLATAKGGTAPKTAPTVSATAAEGPVGTTASSAIEIADDDEPATKGTAKKRPASPDRARRLSASQAKRPKVAHKAVPRKTTGGKSVAGLSGVAGKTLRKASVSGGAGSGAAGGKHFRRKSGMGQ